jgi:hypothetical protein
LHKAISKHPKVQQAEQMAVRSAQAEILATLKANHPDYTEIIKDNSFIDWIGKSKVRQELLVEQTAITILTQRMSCYLLGKNETSSRSIKSSRTSTT